MKKTLILLLGIVLISLISAGGVPDPFGDYDNDLVLNWQDNCYYVWNPFQEDRDGDGFGDCCDPDHIGLGYCNNPSFEFCGDGICNSLENCSTCQEDCGYCPIPNNQTNNTNNQTNNNTDDKSCSRISANKNHVAIFCYPNWKCSGWGECNNGIMKRTCTDTNHCPVEFNKPLEEVGCEEAIIKSAIDGKKINASGIVIGIFIFLIIVLLVFLLIGWK